MFARVRSLNRMVFQRKLWERNLTDEIRFHLETRADELVRLGVPRSEALRQAQLEYGGREGWRERCREAHGARWIDELSRNLTYAVRSMRKHPGFAVVAVLSLTLGIGANAAIFALLQRLMLSPLPVRDPKGLYQVVLSSAQGNSYSVSYPNFEKLRDYFPLFSALCGWGAYGMHEVAEGEQRERLSIAFVTGTYFETLGVRPALGSLIGVDDDRGGTANVAVLSYRLWKSRFGGDPTILAHTLKIDSRLDYRVIGVAPPEFTGAEPASPPDLYIPLHGIERTQALQQERTPLLHVMVRLKRKVTEAHARAVLRDGWAQLARSSQASVGDHSRPHSLILENGSNGYSEVRAAFSRPVLVLMGLVAVVFAIACANLATLLFVRGSGRAGEMAIRTALGACRAQLIRQGLTEAFLLAAAGGLGGLLTAGWIDDLLLYFVAEPNRDFLRFHSTAAVLAFTFGLTVIAALFFGLPPAIRASRVNAEAALRAHAQSVLGGRGQAGRVTLATQVAASMVLVVGALLFARTLWNLNKTSGGFERSAVLYAQPRFSPAQVPPDRAAAVVRDVMQRLRDSHDFACISMGPPPIYSGPVARGWVVVPGYAYSPSEDNTAVGYPIAPQYFRTLGIALVAGRDFEERDRVVPPRTVIVNEKFAAHYFARKNAIGRKFSLSDAPPMEIIGVVRDTKSSSLRERTRDTFYRPIPANTYYTLVARIKSGADASQGEAEIRQVFASVAGKSIDVETGRLENAVRDSLRRDRMVAELSATFGLLGLLLASIGLYGTIAHSVASRTREVGIRMALGADRWAIMRMVCVQGLAISGLGIVAGVPLAMIGARSIESLLFGVSPADPLVVGGSAGLMTLVALLAGLLPARRASRLDPTRALRYE